MPTASPRHQVTETKELAAALDEAAAPWPRLSREQLITQPALEGHRAIAARQRQHRSTVLQALADLEVETLQFSQGSARSTSGRAWHRSTIG